MTRRRRSRMPNPFGTTEEYNARMEKLSKPNYDTRYDKVRREITRNDDMFVRSIYAERDRLNDLETGIDDPWEVDHIRPLAQGGLHVYENLRLLRASKNCDDMSRPEWKIDMILKLVAYNRRQGYIS